MRTAYPRANGPDFAEAVFSGVEGYVLFGDALGTIVFDIEEVDALAMYDEFGEQMQQAYSASGGHAPWVRTRATTERFCRENDIKGFRVTSSIGLTGAIWARSFVARILEP